MSLSTTGLIFEPRDSGELRVGYTDYDVEFFDGDDFECYYDLDRENTDRLCAALGTDRNGLEKTLGEFVGANFNSPKFEAFCYDNGIKYSRHTYH